MNTIKIITDNGSTFDYYNVDALNIRLNRKVEDFNDLETRFSEFSYQFSLPKTKNNNTIFMHADTKDVINKFERQNFNVTVLLNSSVLFKGVLSLLSVDEENYNCVLLSKVSLLIDELGDKELREIESLPDIDFEYEGTIRAHVNANYQNCDETPYQFPLIYYSTFFTPPAVLSGQTDFSGIPFFADRKIQNYYYLVNKTTADNQVFFHQLPLCYYIKPVMEAILEDAGWSLSGTFFDREEIKRIIIPYVGNNDIYDDSVYCSDGSTPLTGGTCATGTLKLKTVNFLPEITQVEFISALINTFNLYFDINLEQKTIAFETYNSLFLNKNNPYNLDNKIVGETVVVEKMENNNPSIRFEEVEYNPILGDNTIMMTGSTNALTQRYKKIQETPNIYDYVGVDDEPIEIELGQPIIKKLYLRNSADFSGSVTGGIDSIVFIPQLTKQTLRDNNNMPFYNRDTDTVVNNEEDKIKHDGLPTLFYYYGQSDCNFVQQSGKGDSSNWFYINFDGEKMRIPFASPYAYSQQRTRINQILNTTDSLEERAYASGMQSIYLMLGSGYTQQIDFSLVLSEMGEVYPTIYNEFYEEKFRRYREGYAVSAEILLNIQDWNTMKMHVPLLYNKQIYSLLSIDDYDVVNSKARIRMIRH